MHLFIYLNLNGNHIKYLKINVNNIHRLKYLVKLSRWAYENINVTIYNILCIKSFLIHLVNFIITCLWIIYNNSRQRTCDYF